jgi:hypothetical protein
MKKQVNLGKGTGQSREGTIVWVKQRAKVMETAKMPHY